jgi:hypothetical protein
MTQSQYISLGAIAGLAIRFWMAHGDLHLFINPLFPMVVHYQPWV